MRACLPCLTIVLAGSVWTGSAAAQGTEVVVIGKKPETVEKIDRVSYDVAEYPEAEAGVILDILRKLPSVTVTPDGQVQVRGATVTILIDGKMPADGNAVVKLLASADVARIEVITNPSAQFAPDGTGGVINIITRKRRHIRLSGDVNLQANTLGQGSMSLSAAANMQAWTLGSQLRFDHWQNRSRAIERQAFFNSSGSYDRLDRVDRLRSASDEASGGVSVEYRLSPDGSLSLKGDYGNYDAVTKGVSSYSGIEIFEEASVIASDSHNGSVQAQYDYHGQAGEVFSLNFDHSDYASRTVSTYDREGDIYAVASDIGGNSNRLQGDYERRFGAWLLMAGMYIDRTLSRDRSQLDTDGADLALTVDDYDYAFSGARTLTAAYVIWQTPLGGWKLMPGLRLEREQLDLPANDIDDVTVYPSLHVSRNLDDTSRIKFSYSRRVARPSISEYNPNVEYSRSNTVAAGNTSLKPQFTDSLETAYDFDHDDFGVNATVYVRDTRGSISPYSLATPDGVLVTTPINAGHSRSGGTELSVHGRLSKRLKYTLNGNLYYATMPFIDGATTRVRGAMSGSGNSLLEYVAANGDQYQINLTGFGRKLTYQGHTDGAWRADITWRRPLSDKLAVVVTVTDLFNSFHFRSVVDTTALKTESVNRANLQSVKVALSYRFGNDE